MFNKPEFDYNMTEDSHGISRIYSTDQLKTITFHIQENCAGQFYFLARFHHKVVMPCFDNYHFIYDNMPEHDSKHIDESDFKKSHAHLSTFQPRISLKEFSCVIDKVNELPTFDYTAKNLLMDSLQPGAMDNKVFMRYVDNFIKYECSKTFYSDNPYQIKLISNSDAKNSISAYADALLMLNLPKIKIISSTESYELNSFYFGYRYNFSFQKEINLENYSANNDVFSSTSIATGISATGIAIYGLFKWLRKKPTDQTNEILAQDFPANKQL